MLAAKSTKKYEVNEISRHFCPCAQYGGCDANLLSWSIQPNHIHLEIWAINKKLKQTFIGKYIFQVPHRFFDLFAHTSFLDDFKQAYFKTITLHWFPIVYWWYWKIVVAHTNVTHTHRAQTWIKSHSIWLWRLVAHWANKRKSEIQRNYFSYVFFFFGFCFVLDGIWNFWLHARMTTHWLRVDMSAALLLNRRTE